MAIITDIFEFAATNTDYWTEFLSGGDYPNELTEEETQALTAARQHVDELIVEILHATGEKFIELARCPTKRFNAKNTTANRSITIPRPAGLERRLYGIAFSLDPNDAGTAVALHASLDVKMGSMEALCQTLSECNVQHSIDHHHVYAPGIAIVAHTNVADLATRSANQAMALLQPLLP